MMADQGGAHRSVLLTVRFSYYQGKEWFFVLPNLDIARRVVQDDSKTLGLPPPPLHHIHVIAPGVAEFYWSSYVDSNLQAILRRKIFPDLQDHILIHDSTLHEASIESIELYEEIDKTGPDPDRYIQLHPASPLEVTVRRNRRNHPDPRSWNQAVPSSSQGSSLVTPRRQRSSHFPQQPQVSLTAVSMLPFRPASILDANRETVIAFDQSALASEFSDENKLIANADEAPVALPLISSRLSVVVDPLESKTAMGTKFLPVPQYK
ncbi:hypothetical protein IW261DRAFT_459023 [Armillaria novae-zelandiae]|uniref:Uncharacterized protein n=1 Tax=Armillaria novae-zelandiae TaxID=153914 RepID=A0AA39P1G2_9AGAR|nr:hypothetical protein IW261DRAFT_459023 [Armillaria novae-zelandiae]